jgi:hypothetical protein
VFVPMLRKGIMAKNANFVEPRKIKGDLKEKNIGIKYASLHRQQS